MLTFALATIVAIAATSPAAAASFGLYFDVATGDVMPDDAFLGGLTYGTMRYSAGISTDTAVAKDKLFNYRMNLGYENVQESIASFGNFSSYHGASFENIFGFGVYRSRLMRVWLGPSLRIAGGAIDKSTLLGSQIPSGRY